MAMGPRMIGQVGDSVLSELNQRPDIDLDKVHVWVRGEPVAFAPAHFESEFAVNLPPSDAAVVFVDLHPGQNWTHECEIRLHDTDNGLPMAGSRSLLPPADFYLNRSLYRAVHAPETALDLGSNLKRERVEGNETPALDANAVAGQRYALLFSGMSDNRHLNDLEFLYRVLIGRYGWDPGNIIVLNYDGSVNYAGAPSPIGNWPGDNTPYRIRVDGPGDPAALAQAFMTIGARLRQNDLLLVHTNNHGGGAPDYPEAWLCCYPNWGSYGVTQYSLALASLPPITSLVVMMEQCHSGGYLDATIANSRAARTSFAAACEFDQNSMGGPFFDPFAHDWIQAIQNPGTSAADAFASALASKVPGDTPVYRDRPNGAGGGQSL